jgi:hypothetical protein
LERIRNRFVMTCGGPGPIFAALFEFGSEIHNF